MKLVYNSHEIGDNHNNYNRLLDKPLINSTELVGNITLNDINVYSKEEVKRLISSTRSVKVALVLPSPVTPNTTYYIGPDMNGIYTVYLTDSSDPINVFSIGTTSFGKYYSGDGINVTDPQNVVSVLTDSESVIINSEGLLEARPVFEKMVPFKGATASADGSGGIVPKPEASDFNFMCYLTGDSDWRAYSLVHLIHPVGSIMFTIGNTNPTNMGTGWGPTTWEKLSANNAFQTDDTGNGTVAAGLPNIKGDWKYARGAGPTGFGTAAFTGAFQKYSNANAKGCIYANDGHANTSNVHFSANKSSSVYTDSFTTVRPNSVTVVAWRRTA